MRRLTRSAPRGAGLDSRRLAEGACQVDPDHDEDDVRSRSVRAGRRRSGCSRVRSIVRSTVAPFCTSNAVPLELAANDSPSSGSTVGSTVGSCSTTVTASPRCVERFRHLEADVAGADDDGALRRSGESAVEHEAVAHGVQLVDALASTPAMGGRTGTAPVAMRSLS